MELLTIFDIWMILDGINPLDDIDPVKRLHITRQRATKSTKPLLFSGNVSGSCYLAKGVHDWPPISCGLTP